MSVFTENELTYLLGERRLARIATVGPDGTPHVAPVGWSYNRDYETIDVGGMNLERSDLPELEQAITRLSQRQPLIRSGRTRCPPDPA